MKTIVFKFKHDVTIFECLPHGCSGTEGWGDPLGIFNQWNHTGTGKGRTLWPFRL